MSLPGLDGMVHLGVAEGCGGTTFALQHVRETLSSGGRVIWVSPSSPDPERFRQMMLSVPMQTLSRLHLLPCGDALPMGIKSAGRLASTLNTDLIVIDDWTPRTGRADRAALAAIRELNDTLSENDSALLLISSIYEDASGKGQRMIRGRSSLEELGCVTWSLVVEEGGVQQRSLEMSDSAISLLLGDEGFVEPTHSSSKSSA